MARPRGAARRAGTSTGGRRAGPPWRSHTPVRAGNGGGDGDARGGQCLEAGAIAPSARDVSGTAQEALDNTPIRPATAHSLLGTAGGQTFGTLLADPPWRFRNRGGKVAPEHKRLMRYATMDVAEIAALPVAGIAAATAHLYLWVPNALLAEGLHVMAAWGFAYKTNLVWQKLRKDGGPDGRGVGFYFRNTTELRLFGVRGRHARTRDAGRRQVNLMASRKREHSRKPDEQYPIIEACSPAPWIELFARGARHGWAVWGDEATDDNPARTGDSGEANHGPGDRAHPSS
jgi:N6-adenosine-specific RNA methylase IME4